MLRHLAANLLTLIIVAMVAVSGVIYWGQSQYTAPGPLAEPVIVTVERGARLADVTEAMLEVGAITNETVFRLGARYDEYDRRLRFGEYQIPAGASMRDILALVASGRSIQYFVTIPEGLTSWEAVQILNAKELLTGEIAEIPPEGSLAPDTYSFDRNANRNDLIARMTQAQEQILAEAWANRQEGLPLESPEELLILASIVEKETAVPDERWDVSSVFVNRLNQGMRLQTDPTVIYGITLGQGPLGRGIRRSELDRETPYNTYQIDGLPPTPIANPGRAAIQAAANPSDVPYIFFVADGTGGHAFAVTYADHQRNVARWRQIERERE